MRFNYEIQCVPAALSSSSRQRGKEWRPVGIRNNSATKNKKKKSVKLFKFLVRTLEYETYLFLYTPTCTGGPRNFPKNNWPERLDIRKVNRTGKNVETFRKIILTDNNHTESRRLEQ